MNEPSMNYWHNTIKAEIARFGCAQQDSVKHLIDAIAEPEPPPLKPVSKMFGSFGGEFSRNVTDAIEEVRAGLRVKGEEIDAIQNHVQACERAIGEIGRKIGSIRTEVEKWPASDQATIEACSTAIRISESRQRTVNESTDTRCAALGRRLEGIEKFLGYLVASAWNVKGDFEEFARMIQPANLPLERDDEKENA